MSHSSEECLHVCIQAGREKERVDGCNVSPFTQIGNTNS